MWIGFVYVEQHQRPPEGRSLDLELKVWGYALEDIPTHHLAECFKRALRAHRGDYMLKAAAVLEAWDGLREELRAVAQAHAEGVTAELMAGRGSLGAISFREFKARHNLPATWKFGQPYPPESDLYRGETPPAVVRIEVRRPSEVWDSRWHATQKKPWELYPPPEHPDVREIVSMSGRRYRFMHWVTRCPEAENPAGECPGYIEVHTGPEGSWVTLRSCPDHWNRWNGERPGERAS